MSSDTYDKYAEKFTRADHYRSNDREVSRRAEAARAAEIAAHATRTRSEAPRTRAKTAEPARQPVDRGLAQNRITCPALGTTDAYILVIDNSGSNREIARSLQRASGYMLAVMRSIMPNAGLAMHFFSDHCDGPDMIQEVNWVLPGDEGARVLQASISTLHSPSGGDEPEAIECALYEVSGYNLAALEKKHRHALLITDQVAHGMGYPGRDDGCSAQRNWRDSLQRIHEVYGTFELIATGGDQRVFELQKQFITPERRKFDLLDMTTGQDMTHEERCRLVANAALLFMARSHGTQTAEAFLMMLLEKWLADPQYGSNTLSRAKGQIADFVEYLEESPERKSGILERIFGALGNY